MKKLLLTLLTVTFVSATFAQQDKRLKGIEKDLNAVLAATKASGFAVAVVQGDKIIYAKGFGYSDYENKIPVDANTLFAIGSSTKAFTSSVLGQLQTEGKLSFDDSPIKYVPQLKFFNNDMNNNIIIKDLMSHRTGLPRHDYSWYLFPSHNKDSILLKVAHHEPFTGIRQQWYYNNFMFLAQGVIAERITGKTWEENIKERFFVPLGMNRSNASIAEMKASTNIAVGYDLKKDSIISKTDYYDIAGMSPAGSINSSVNDMSNWMITWLNKGKFKDQQILSEAYVAEAMSSQMVVSGNIPDKEFPDMYLSNYGYGWFLSSYRGHYRVEHGGNIDGFSANVVLFPSDEIGIVVLTNQDGSPVPNLVRSIVADRMLKQPTIDWTKRFVERKLKAKKAAKEAKEAVVVDKTAKTAPSHKLEEYTGNFSHPGYGSFVIAVEKDSLFANFKFKKFYLKPVFYDIFDVLEVTKQGIDTTETDLLRLNFVTNNAGAISGVKMQIEPTLAPIEFKQSPNLIKVEEAALEKYVGDYDMGGTALKIYIKDKNKLFLFLSGQPEYELLSTDKHKFNFKILDGFKIEFTENDAQTINGMIVIQPNGTFKAVKK